MWEILAIISALFSGLAAVFEKKALFRMDPLGFSLLLSALTFLFTFPFLFFVSAGSVTTVAVLLLFLKSLLGAAAFLLVMHGIQKNELSNSLPLLSLTPAVVAVLAFFLLGEKIGLYGIAGMLLLLAGTYFLQLEKGGDWRSPFLFVKRNRAQGYILAAILLFSATTLLDKTILKNYELPPEAFLPIQQLFFTLIFLLVFLSGKGRFNTVRRQFKLSWKIILLVAVFAVIYRYSHILALKAGPIALVLAIKRTSVFFATVIGGHYFREHNVLTRSLAVIAMVAGAVIIILF